jgi:PKD repeat protein
MKIVILLILLLPIALMAQTEMMPFLQTPTASSMYVSWMGASADESSVQYGTTADLGLTATGTVFTYNTTTKWHSAKLTNLSPNTRYYYKCITGTQTSAVNSFTTAPAVGSTDGHLRVIMMGDTRTNTGDVVNLVTAIQAKCLELYGADWRQKINLLCHVGDSATSASSINTLVTEFITPFAPLASSIPIMIAAGNHEGENANFYNLMQTTEVAGPEGKKYYALDLADSRFLFLNSNTMGTTQANWLTTKLTEANNDNNTDFVFGIIHHYGHSEFQPLENNAWVQNTVIPALGAIAKPTQLAYGHAHCYERGTSMTTKTRLLLCGGGGAPLDTWTTNTSQQDYPEINIALDYWLYTIIDIDLATHKYEAKMFTRGNTHTPLNNVQMDSWSQSVAPVVYQAKTISANAPEGGQVKLVSSPLQIYNDMQMMSSQFQVSTNNTFSTTLIDNTRNWEDIYRNTGAPNYTPIDVNAGIDLKRFKITTTNVQQGQTYFWRVRYRSQNADWGDWTAAQQFTYSPLPVNADFVHTVVNDINIPVQFTDTSVGEATAWAWDFDNDGDAESTLQDPVWTFTTAGLQHVTLNVTMGGQLYSTMQTIQIGTSTVDQITPALIQNISVYPNPSIGSFNIAFDLKQAVATNVSVYNLKGELVKSLVSQTLKQGNNNLSWDGENNIGVKASAGLYVIKITSAGQTSSKKIVIVQ